MTGSIETPFGNRPEGRVMTTATHRCTHCNQPADDFLHPHPPALVLRQLPPAAAATCLTKSKHPANDQGDGHSKKARRWYQMTHTATS